MSKNFEKIKENYEKGFYSKAMVRAIVGKKNGITKAEFKLITGEDF